MNDTGESQVLMFFQTYGKNEGINITRGQVTYHRDPVPIKNLRKGVDGSMVQPIATAIIMLMKAHGYMAASNCAPPPPAGARAFKEFTSRLQQRMPHSTRVSP
jgi:hypothetical protein